MSSASPSEEPVPTFGVEWDRPIPATWGLVVVLVAIHFLGAWHEYAAGLSGFWEGAIFERDTRFRVAVGGQHANLVAYGEVWRLWTSVLLHIDLLHLFLNSVALLSLGRILEPWIGSMRWLSWFILGGLGGSLASQFGGVIQSDGASGGAFALLGASAMIGLKVRGRLDKREATLMGPVIWGFLLLNLILPVFLPFIDSLGHIGGLAMGLFVGGFIGLHDAPALRAFDGVLVFLFTGACGVGWYLA